MILRLTYGFVLLVVALGCKSPEARLPEQVSSGLFIKQSAERNKKLNAIERQQIEALITATNKPFVTSENGFWYHYNTQLEKDTLMPKFGDLVSFNYSVADLNNTPIYTSEDIGSQKYLMDKEELFTGLREGLKLMKPTEDVTFIFPSQIAYGYYGDDNKIGTNMPIICRVKLNTITKNNND